MCELQYLPNSYTICLYSEHWFINKNFQPYEMSKNNVNALSLGRYNLVHLMSTYIGVVNHYLYITQVCLFQSRDIIKIKSELVWKQIILGILAIGEAKWQKIWTLWDVKALLHACRHQRAALTSHDSNKNTIIGVARPHLTWMTWQQLVLFFKVHRAFIRRPCRHTLCSVFQ